jgi:predicted transcriptional regulator
MPAFNLEQILDQIIDGKSQRDIAKIYGVNQSAVCRWLRSQENAPAYHAAMRIRGDMLMEDLLELADSPVRRLANGNIDRGHLENKRLRVRTLMTRAGQLFARYKPSA